MKRFPVWIGTLCLFVSMVCGFQPITGYGGTMDLITTLVDTLGITKEQAKGGSGALFQNAKDNLSVGDFQKVSDSGAGWKNQERSGRGPREFSFITWRGFLKGGIHARSKQCFFKVGYEFRHFGQIYSGGSGFCSI